MVLNQSNIKNAHKSLQELGFSSKRAHRAKLTFTVRLDERNEKRGIERERSYEGSPTKTTKSNISKIVSRSKKSCEVEGKGGKS